VKNHEQDYYCEGKANYRVELMEKWKQLSNEEKEVWNIKAKPKYERKEKKIGDKEEGK